MVINYFTVDFVSECVKYVKSFNIPTLVLGGGGYTIYVMLLAVGLMKLHYC